MLRLLKYLVIKNTVIVTILYYVKFVSIYSVNIDLLKVFYLPATVKKLYPKPHNYAMFVQVSVYSHY